MVDKELLEKMRKDAHEALRYKETIMEGYQTDQQLKKVQPPLVKEKMCHVQIDLPRNFDDLNLDKNLTQLLIERKSSRVYSSQNITLLELSYLLWAAQGIKAIRGKRYATIRTAPCGGARHPFELYFVAQYVDGLKPGYYHYLPMTHQIECIDENPKIHETLSDLMVGQVWAERSSVIFIYSIVPYRSEWRYGVTATYLNQNDMGHVGENVYLAATALGLGTCGVGAFDQYKCDELFKLNTDEEFCFYSQTIGTIDEKTALKEDDLYAFLKTEEDEYVN
ncbi:MAG: SagB/ThcOx family dehydrogenase [Erysipelotrichaceae bacterium]|nr:SagB/ThcOx family dehydrogenase [Erysipelotrichaceae bacterium]